MRPLPKRDSRAAIAAFLSLLAPGRVLVPERVGSPKGGGCVALPANMVGRPPGYRYAPVLPHSQCASGPRRCALRNSANGKPPWRLFSEVSYEPSPSFPCVEDFASPKTPPRGVFASLTQRATLVGITRRTYARILPWSRNNKRTPKRCPFVIWLRGWDVS